MNKRNAAMLVALILSVVLSVPAVQSQEADEVDQKPATFEDVRKEMSDLMTTLKSYSAKERDQAIEQTKEVLAKIDRRIESLEAEINRNWAAMSEEAREKSRQSMQELRQQRLKVAEWYGSLKSSSVVAWEQIKEGFTDAYQAFADSWEKAEADVDSAK